MKFLNLVIFAIVISLVLVETGNVFADDANEMSVRNILVSPSVIKIGDTFSVNATLINNSSNTVYVEHGVCEAPFSVSFDTHVHVVENRLNCTTQMVLQKLDPGETITATSPYLDLAYKAISSGVSNADLTFSYLKWDPTTQSDVEKTISKSFIFPILDNPTNLITGQNSWQAPAQHVGLFKSPLQQLKDGINHDEVKCNQGLKLIFKLENMYPVCVKPDTSKILIRNGWATPMSGISFGGSTYAINDTQVSKMDNSASALNLYMSTDSYIINPGQPIGVTISVNNTLGFPVDVTSQNNWSYTHVNTGPCSTIGYGVSILDGFYDENNMTGGKILNLFNPGILCPAVQETAKVYEFKSHSSDVKESQCKSIEGFQCRTDAYQMGQQYKFDGYWDAGMVQPFKPGVYTIVGADEWGHVEVRHFVVTNGTIFAGDLGSTSCPMFIDGARFETTIKNSTGFAHYYNSSQYGNTFFLHHDMTGKINLQYHADALWFENSGNQPHVISNGATLYYMANMTVGKTVTSYAVSLYSDDAGNHSTICHYASVHGGFAEPCNMDNTGNIPPSEMSNASKLLHPGVTASSEPHSVTLYPDSSPEYSVTVSANSDAMVGVYWIFLGQGMCGPHTLVKLVIY